jgi:hypothetical protein
LNEANLTPQLTRYKSIALLKSDIYWESYIVVLDHPNIALPVLGQACFEFQWYPFLTIQCKDFVDVCGDLNVVIGIISAINLFSARFVFTSSVGTFCVVARFYGHFGQFHTPVPTQSVLKPSCAREMVVARWVS